MTVAVVTGAASGIGAAVSRSFAARGVQVVGIDLRDTDICADLSTHAGRRAAIDATLAKTGGTIDRLVCCAGLGPQAEPASLVASVNYFGAVALLDGLFDALKRGDAPSAVVVSSNSATLQSWAGSPLRSAYLSGDETGVHDLLRAVPAEQAGFVAYASSKNAVTVAVRQRAAAWGGARVRLNAVAPGPVNTPLLQAGLKDARYGDAIRDFVPPLGRRAEPDEIATLIAFLCGEDAAYVHGSVLFVDGGHDAAQRSTMF
ncbi:SDR family oxidoreductase [Burkholderia guangdongensis]|uniref:SDR family oxidoreductase n=1 Tax=Burkholderia guangdongensis TaxID=1792500 RepID=UPI0015C7E5AC|nr:SDR family oxidoreductase [Burkholderia guangdongensis]